MFKIEQDHFDYLPIIKIINTNTEELLMENNCALHGFLYNTKMKIVESICDENLGRLKFNVNLDGHNKGYPFKLQINIIFILSSKGLKITTEIENCDEKPVPLSDGWHPYFKFDTAVDKLMIKIPSIKQTELNNRLVPTGKTLENDEYYTLSKIGKTKFDNGYKLERKSSIVKTELYSPEKDVTINLWQETGPNKYNFIQVYTPPHRNSIAIEPLTSNINCFNNNDGLIKLRPEEIFSASYGVYLT